VIRFEQRVLGKHRRLVVAVTHDWTRWPRHRDDNTMAGPAASDGMEEYARKWVAAMKVREVELHRRRQAVWS
jgi:hypothetical protein